MSLTISKIEDHAMFGKRVVFAEIDFDTSYESSGEPLIPGDVGMSFFTRVFIEHNSGYIFQYDYTNEVLQAYWGTYGGGAAAVFTEVTAATNMASVTGVKAMFIGH